MTNPFKTKKEAVEDVESFIDSLEADEETVETEVIEEQPEVEEEQPEVEEEIPPEIIQSKRTRKKLIKYRKTAEKEKTSMPFSMNRAILFLCMLGIMGIIFLYQMVAEVSMAVALILMLFGMLCFLPLGLLLGKLFLDPYVRCKILRRVKGKNYGMVYFVHKGGQRVDIRIKNLDDDVVVQDTKLWVLEKASIYYTDIDDAYLRHATITDRSIVTSPNNVPILFLDAENMLPLRFFESKTKSNPQQVGATCLGYINNQIAKNLFFKRSMQTFYVLMLVLQAINITGLIMLYDALVGI